MATQKSTLVHNTSKSIVYNFMSKQKSSLFHNTS